MNLPGDSQLPVADFHQYGEVLAQATREKGASADQIRIYQKAGLPSVQKWEEKSSC